MKKLLYVLIMMLGLFIGFRNVEAGTKDDLKKKLNETYDINGEKYTIPENIKVTLNRYLDEYKLSSKDIDYILSKIDVAVKKLHDSGITDLENLDKSTKDELKQVVEDVSANTSVEATVKNGNIVIYKPDKTGVFAEISNPVKQTDFDSNYNTVIVGISVIITLVGTALISKKVRNCE